MEIHIIQVGLIGLTLLRKCVPEQQKGDKQLEVTFSQLVCIIRCNLTTI
jgi:hypothetical protein